MKGGKFGLVSSVRMQSDMAFLLRWASEPTDFLISASFCNVHVKIIRCDLN